MRSIWYSIRQSIWRHRMLVQAAIWVTAAAWVVFVWLQLGSPLIRLNSADLKDKNPAARAEAVRHLNVKSDRDALIKMLSDEDPDVRVLAAQGLFGPGPGEAERARALVPLLEDENMAVRREAARSLSDAQMDSKALKKALNADQRAKADKLIHEILAPPPPENDTKGSSSSEE